jgi:hypothetical protein
VDEHSGVTANAGELLSNRKLGEIEQSAHAHEHEALLHDRLAAQTPGCLYFAFLHAAEAHRVAARRARSSAAS